MLVSLLTSRQVMWTQIPEQPPYWGVATLDLNPSQPGGGQSLEAINPMTGPLQCLTWGQPVPAQQGCSSHTSDRREAGRWRDDWQDSAALA